MKMIKNRKFSKFLLSIFLPVVVFLSIGFFSFGAISTALAMPFVTPDNAGGAFYIGNNSTITMTTGTISGFSKTFGGGVYVSDGGTFNMSGGAIYGNTATYSGSQIYNSGTFTMTGGTIGKNGTTASEDGIYNGGIAGGEMNLYGGTIYEGIYSEYATLSTKMACNIQGTITLPNNESITVEDYAGTTPSYKIVISSTRETGTIVTLKGSSTEPDVSKLNISGYNTSKYAVKTVKDSSGNWTVALANNSFEFPSDWKTEVASTDYMTTTVTPANLTSIKFVPTVPSGYTKIGTLSTGLPVYKGTTATDIAFVGKKIFAPENSYKLFDSLSKLKTLDMSVLNTSKVTDMSFMFRSCSALTSLNVSNFDTSKVTNMSSMFRSCSVLTSLGVSGFDTSKVTDMSMMFDTCSSLTSLDVSGFNTSNVTHMRYMFYYCLKLTSLDLSNFNTSKVTDMNYMFRDCSALTSLDLSSFNMAKVTNSGYMLDFGTSNKIQTLKTPYNNSTAIAITTGSTLYKEDTGAVVTSVPANTTKSLTYVDETPNKTFPTTWKTEVASSTYMTTTVTPANLTSIKFAPTVPSGYTQIGTLSNGLPVYKGTSATDIAFVEKKIYAPENSSQLFYRLSKLTTLDMSVFDTSNATNMSYMFSYCSALTSLNVSNFDTSKVTDMGMMFYKCSALTSLDVSGFNTSNVTKMDYMFDACSALTSLDVSNFDTSKVTNMTCMFYDCSALTSLDVSGFNTSIVTNMSSMFGHCSALTSLDLSSFNMTKVTDSANMLYFGTSNKIQTLKTPYNNSSAIEITTGSTLYNEDTGAVVTSVPANTTKSLTYVNENPEKELPTDWKTQLNSSTYMTSTRSTVTGIRFESTVPTGFVQIGKLSTGLKVYANGNNIAFINKKTIYAPADSSYLFANNASLTSISFTNFNTSKATTMARMFSGASGLTTIDVTSFNTSKVTSMTYMFNACTKLQTIKIAGIDTSNVTTMASMFAHCTALSSLNLTGFNTAKVTNMSIMFGYLTNLSKLDLSMFNTANVTTMQQMFYQSTGIKVLNLSSFNMSKTTTTTNMLNFGSSGNLGRIQTPYNNKSALAITTSGTLYNTSTGSSVTGVSANTSSSKTFAKKVTVTFNAYGGTTPSTTTYTKYYGATFGSSYPSTSRTDYTFQGWYTEISGGSSIDYYVLVGDTTFYAHWSSNSGGGGSGGGGTDPEPTPTLPSSFERRHERSELGDEISTLDEQSIFDILDIFNSESSNTFTAADVTKFAIVSNDTYNDYRIERQIGTVGNMEVAVLSYVGSGYDSLLSGDEWILGIMNNSGTIGFDQWYYFDSMFFMKLSEILPYLVTLDLRGLDASLTTFSFRLPGSVENVIINDSSAPLLSHRVVNFVTMGQGTIHSTGFGGFASPGEGVIGNLNLNTILSGNISESEMGEIKGFAVFSTNSPEQYADYIFQHEYGQIASGVYLCLVRVTDDFTSKFSGVSTDDVFLAFVSYTSPIYFDERFEAAGGFGDYIEIGGSIYYADFRGLSVVPNDNVPSMARNLQVNFPQEIILPEDYDNGMLQFETNATLINHDGSTRSFISGNNNGSSGNLEIARTKLYNVTAEDVDLYIDDKKWFDPRKNKIQIKTQNDGEK